MGVRQSSDSLLVAGRPLVPGEEPLDSKNKNYQLWKPVSEVDERDMKCADSWVPRHPDLIRLTGKHPFNAEPPHEDVMNAGWLTPVSMHFVRNHGAVPRLEWSTHRINITGMVDRPLEVSMDDLLRLPPITVPVRLTCCGNRRKEVNMVKNSQGFSWGPAAVGVNYWTGARLSDVLKLAGCKTFADGARCVFCCCLAPVGLFGNRAAAPCLKICAATHEALPAGLCISLAPRASFPRETITRMVLRFRFRTPWIQPRRC